MKKILLGIFCFFASLSAIQAQVLYSMTSNGGSSGVGVIFSFDPSSSTYTKLKDFDNTNGAYPFGRLLHATDGKLYGMTTRGGSNNGGVIFSFDPSTLIYTKLKDFDFNPGYGSFSQNDGPYGSLMQASNGKLYGMMWNGGIGAGTIFSYDLSSSTYTKLMDFDGTNGGSPYGDLIQASDGKLYGMTYRGGSGDSGGPVPVNPGGVIFSFDPSTSTYTKLKDFAGSNGSAPRGNLIQASDGKLYGMTRGGGSNNYGVIFSFDVSTATYTKLKDFDGINGGSPFGSLMQAGNGKLYGMTNQNPGGINNSSAIFSFDPSSSTYTKLKDFDGTNGSNPFGSLMQASDGKLYGMTYDGGSNNLGVIFSFNITTSTYTKLKDYDGANGANPFYGAFIEVPFGSLPVTLTSFTGKNNGASNQLSWEVENEQNLNYYELQRGTDGQNFIGVSQIKAARNNSYSYNDNIAAAVSPVYYYRLKSVDKDGHFKYSMIIKIRTGSNRIFAEVNPNPFKNKLVIHVESLILHKATFILTDLSGRQVYKGNKFLSAGTNVVEINETGRLSKGTYLLTIIESQQTQSIKVVKGN